ncbi:pre-toxin TG domain-containing protein, partial [Aerococcaceae bacterium NML160702]|nr:pre-toxin TG domain-containing protein [Aerococcaceae bacterium NML160702]
GHLIGEFTGYYDVKRLITGVDPITGQKANRLEATGSLVIGFISGGAGKIGKAGKLADAMNDLRKGATIAKAVDIAGDTTRVTNAVDKLNDTRKVANVADKATDTGKAVVKNADSAGNVSKTVGSHLDMKDLNSFRNNSFEDVEKYLDQTLEGYTKAPLKKGEGIRYFDGKGNSWQLNRGYANASDSIHAGNYLKTTQNGQVIRIPLD